MKKFDASKKVVREDLDKVLEAIRMAPTSYGMQPFYVTIIEDQGLKKELRQYSYDQSQVENASALLVFSIYDVAKRGEEFLKLLEVNGVTKEKIDYMRSAFSEYNEMTDEGRRGWADKQLGIALGFGLAALAELKIDSCPIEGFFPKDYSRVLGLPEYITPSVALAVGYRSDEEYQRPKLRFSGKDIFDFRQ